MNKIILIGRLTKDAETRQTQSGKTVTNFTLAVSDGKDKAQFFNCQAWEKTGELISQYTQKGSQIAIEGKLSNRSWDKPDGTKGYATDIVVFQVELLGSKRNTNATDNSSDEPPEVDLSDIGNSMPF